MVFHWKRGLVFGLFFAVGTFIIARFTDWHVVFIPGGFLFGFFDKIGLIKIIDIGWEGYVYVIYCNIVIFGIVGFFIGAFLKSWKYVIVAILALAALLFVLGCITGMIR
jgi:hypothetical protein